MKITAWLAGTVAGVASLAAAQTPSEKRSLSCDEKTLIEQTLPSLESALDLTDRLRTASQLASAANTGREAYAHLRDDEWAAVMRGKAAWDAAVARAQEFESHLTQDLLEAATEGETKSIGRATGRLFLASVPTCTAEDFKKLEKNIGLVRLEALAYPVEKIYYLAESNLVKSRTLALADALSHEEGEEPGATELAAYYRVLSESYSGNSVYTPEERTKLIEDEQRTMRGNRVRKEDLEKTVNELVRLAPGCFASSKRERQEFQEAAITRARGKFLLELLPDELERGKRPTDTYNFPMPTDASPLENTSDGWNERFRIRYEGSKAILYSFGPDRENATADDIVVGEVPVPPKR